MKNQSQNDRSPLNSDNRPRLNPSSEYGGAAMEYIIVSLFGTFITLASLSYLASVFERKIQEVAEKMGMDPPTINFNPFSSDG